MAGKQTIAKACKSPSLNVVETKNRVKQAMVHVKFKAVLLDRATKYAKICQPWVDHYLSSHFDASLLFPC